MALLIATGLGSVGSVAAALGALNAATATKDSVTEMREARLQGIRPILVASIGADDRFTFRWCAGHEPELEPGSDLFKTKDQKHPVLSLKNVGDGPAMNVHIAWQGAERDKQPIPIAEIRTFFERGGFEIKDDGEKVVELSDPQRRGRWYYPGSLAGAVTDRTFGLCGPKEEVLLDLRVDTILDQLVDNARPTSVLDSTKTDRLRISYSGISGETFTQIVELRYRLGYIATTFEKGLSRNKEPWDEIRANLHIRLAPVKSA